MKNKNVVATYLNNNISIDLNYNEIKSNINIKTIENHSILSHKRQIRYVLRYTVFLFIIGLITLTSLLIYKGVNNSHGQSSQSWIIPGRFKTVYERNLDELFAYGPKPGNTNVEITNHPFVNTSTAKFQEHVCTIDFLLQTNMFSEDGKRQLKEIKEKKNNRIYCNFYFGIKDNKDVILLKNNINPGEEYIFESVFDYSFNDIITEFEEMIGENINKDFLNGDNSYLMTGIISGIFVDFKLVDGTYIPFYLLDYEGKTYKIEK